MELYLYGVHKDDSSTLCVNKPHQLVRSVNRDCNLFSADGDVRFLKLWPEVVKDAVGFKSRSADSRWKNSVTFLCQIPFELLLDGIHLLTYSILFCLPV